MRLELYHKGRHHRNLYAQLLPRNIRPLKCAVVIFILLMAILTNRMVAKVMISYLYVMYVNI